MSKEFIDLTDICIRFQDASGNEFLALDHINLKIPMGDYVAIVGTSGSGKTTLSNIIGTLNSPTDGEYYLENKALHDLKEKKLEPYRGSVIGFIFQDYVLLDHLSALENVALSMSYTNLNKKEILKISVDALESVGLADKLHHKPPQLSGGQKQRVSIARVLARKPKIIIADEPTGALDEGSRAEVLSILQDLNDNGTTIITVTHSENDAMAAKRLIQIEAGRIVRDIKQGDRIRFFGTYVNADDKEQLDQKITSILEHSKIKYSVNEPETFLALVSLAETISQKNDLIKQLRFHWLENSGVRELLHEWFSKEELSLKIRILKIFLHINASPFVEKMEMRTVRKYLKDPPIDVILALLKEVYSFDVEKILYWMPYQSYFAHPDKKVRATAIHVLKRIEDSIPRAERNMYIESLLKDEDARVRANVLDFLVEYRLVDISDLSVYNFGEDNNSRVKAAWCTMLIRNGKKQDAYNILQPMIESEDVNKIIAALWVLSQDPDFSIHQFLEERIYNHPKLVEKIDDIFSAFSRGRSKMIAES